MNVCAKFQSRCLHCEETDRPAHCHAASVAKININKILLASDLSELSLLSVASPSLKDRDNNVNCFSSFQGGIEGTSGAGGREEDKAKEKKNERVVERGNIERGVEVQDA